VIEQQAGYTVCLALTVEDGTRVAIKCISKNTETSIEMAKLIHTEMMAIHTYQCQNIVKPCEVIEDNNSIYVVTEAIEGKLFLNSIDQFAEYDEGQVIRIVKQVLGGLSFFHS
jgi:serine/threonine protein kinase